MLSFSSVSTSTTLSGLNGFAINGFKSEISITTSSIYLASSSAYCGINSVLAFVLQ
jgi:hypothetical protein